MLFEDVELMSEFDFGNKVSDENASIKCLAEEIHRISQILADKNDPVWFRHKDNYGELIPVKPHKSKNGQKIYDRVPEEIQQILFRNNRRSTIAGFLRKLGIEKPEANLYFKEYLQLLYFFYMMRYYAFEDDSFFRIIEADHITSELSPVEGASQGNYIWFILENLMDDESSCETFNQQVFGYSTLISLITNKIGEYISEESFYENEERAKQIEEVIRGGSTVSSHDWQSGIIIRVMDAFYQYQMLGYSRDMIRNLATDKKMPFCFPEIEIEASKEKWEQRLLDYEQIEDFLKEKDVVEFCKQKEKLNRSDKALRNGPTEVVKYVFREDVKRGTYIFTQEIEDGHIKISGLTVAIIVRTYLDLAKEKVLVDIKKENGWDHNVAFRNALNLTEGDIKAKFAADLAYRLFVVAFYSEKLNVKAGYGYWPALFKPIYLRQYIYVQKCVNVAFSGRNPNEWRDRLRYFIYNLPYIEEA